MSEDVCVKLSEETSQLIYMKYETVQDEYESFDEYMQELNTWLNLKMKETNLKAELKQVQEQIDNLNMKS